MAFDDPGTYNLSLWAGESFGRNFELVSSDGSPFDLTGIVASAVFHPAGLVLTSGAGLTINATAGTVALLLTGAQTAPLRTGIQRWFLELANVATGETGTVIRGSVQVKAP
jgi:hypothetical protein